MRGFGDYHRTLRAKAVGDPRLAEFFHHLRQALDVAEQMMLHPQLSEPVTPPPPLPPVERKVVVVPAALHPMAEYMTITQTMRHFNLGRSTIYRLLAKRAIRAKKSGNRTLIVVASITAYFEALPEGWSDDGRRLRQKF